MARSISLELCCSAGGCKSSAPGESSGLSIVQLYLLFLDFQEHLLLLASGLLTYATLCVILAHIDGRPVSDLPNGLIGIIRLGTLFSHLELY